MSKKSHPRRLKETEAMAGVRMVRVSPRKLNLVAQLIRGKSASAALASVNPLTGGTADVAGGAASVMLTCSPLSSASPAAGC